MERGELAARLVEADETRQNALLQDCRANVDTQLAYLLKDISLDGWSSDPLRSLAASTVLRKICRTHADPEISALCNWTQGIEALIKGDMRGAVSTLDRAHAGFLKLNKPHVAAATEVSKVIALAMLGHYDQAIACALRARQVFLESGDLLAAGKIEHNIGNLYFRRDQYLEAEEFHTSARARFLAVNHEKQLATIDNCLANTHVILRKFSSASALYDEAVQLAERAGMPVTQAEIEGNIGNFALLRGRYDQALDYLERSRRRYESLGMPHQSALAQLALAEAYLELNLVPEAHEIYARVTDTLANLGLQADEARAFASRGRAEVLLGRSEAALTSLKRARELYEAEGNQVGEALVRLSQAQLYHEQGSDGVAHELVVRADADLTAFGGWHQLLLARWLRADIERTLGHADEACGLFERTLSDSKRTGQIAERCHTGLGLLAVSAGETSVAEQHFSSAIAVTEELRAPLPGEEFRTAFFANKLVPYHELLRIRLDDGEVPEALALVESARSRTLVESLGATSESFDVCVLQRTLGKDEALVEYMALGDELLAFVVTRERVQVVRELASVKDVDRRLNAIRSQIDTLRFGAPNMRKYLPTLTQKINVHLKALHDVLIRPLPQIPSRLIVVLHGRLHYLPFHALHDGERYLLEQCEISYAPSAAIFLQCRRRGERRLNRALLLGVSDEQTPRIADEISVLTDVFEDSTTLVEDAATAAGLRSESSRADVVHLACHGQFRSDNPLFSALKLADGWFTVRDAYSLKLDNALVTLSACETGVNAVAPGDELIGLARGFFAAGARSVLLSLWMVDDEATNQMMIDFYQETKRGNSLSASLRAAQLKLLQKHQHPFFWSPFILVGQSN